MIVKSKIRRGLVSVKKYIQLGFCVLCLVVLVGAAFVCCDAFAASVGVSEEEPIDIHADRVEYSRTEDTYVADGNVDVVRGTQHLTSDHVTLNMKANLLIAEGNVHYDDGGQILTADRMELNIESKAGVIFHGTILIK